MKSVTERAQNFQTRNGRKQDLILKVASLLGSIQIEDQFYEYSPKLIKGAHETTERRLRREELQGQARAQLRAAFPDILLTEKTSHLIISKKDRKDISYINEFRAGLVSLTTKPKVQAQADITVDKSQVRILLA
jgi:hypothetical protein